MAVPGPSATIEVRPASSDRWADVEQVLGPKGAYGGCWCMFFRLSGREFDAGAGEANRNSLRALCRTSPPPGLLAYLDGTPVGWCAVAPRADYPRVLRSPINKPAPDDDPADAGVWAVTCFYVHRGQRRSGISTALLAAAVDFAIEHGARIVEGYPNDAGGKQAHPLSLFMGTPELFRAAGFTEHLRRKPRRPVMRYRPKPKHGRS
ncbi:MAG: GNAT family N-acetyltransferase [Sporichthyaceae bacterium]|nr:GNAT family N-acetyltransferase [Sporichthyaceae bacterium]